MSLTTDPNDPKLKEGQKNETGQHEIYLVLPEEERAKGFVRPYRDKYIHIGRYVGTNPPQMLNEEEKENFKSAGYVAFISNITTAKDLGAGTYVTQQGLDSLKDGYINGCGVETVMGRALSETYARNPDFYGATFCVGCNKHLPVQEFVWSNTSEKVGS